METKNKGKSRARRLLLKAAAVSTGALLVGCTNDIIGSNDNPDGSTD